MFLISDSRLENLQAYMSCPMWYKFNFGWLKLPISRTNLHWPSKFEPTKIRTWLVLYKDTKLYILDKLVNMLHGCLVVFSSNFLTMNGYHPRLHLLNGLQIEMFIIYLYIYFRQKMNVIAFFLFKATLKAIKP
jgi:hypothetical protein